LSRYADDVLIADALKLQMDMQEIEETTKNLLYVNKVISNTSSTASSYFDKIKSFVNGTPSEEEKSTIEKSEDDFEHKLQQLNRHISLLKESAVINRKNIAKSRVIADLAIEINKR
jgi:hypothetical protein